MTPGHPFPLALAEARDRRHKGNLRIVTGKREVLLPIVLSDVARWQCLNEDHELIRTNWPNKLHVVSHAVKSDSIAEVAAMRVQFASAAASALEGD